MTVSRFSIGPFRAQGLNLSGSDFVAGIPSPSAALGFAGALARKLGETGWSHRALMVIHDLQEHTGRARGEQSLKDNRLVPLDIPEAITGRGEFTILVEIPGDHSAEKVTSAIQHLRFGGGTIFPPVSKTFDEIVGILTKEEFRKTLDRLPRGMVLAPPAKDRAAATVSFGEEASLEEIAMRAYSQTAKAQHGGYIVPAPVGYRVIEETLVAEPPARCRDKNVPFALVESAVGLAEYVSIRNREALPDLETAFAERAWAWAWDTSQCFKMFSPFHKNSIEKD
jgi:hypothetical protein